MSNLPYKIGFQNQVRLLKLYQPVKNQQFQQNILHRNLIFLRQQGEYKHMEYIMPIFNLAIDLTKKTIQNLGSNNDGLTIEICYTQPQKYVSGLSKISSLNKNIPNYKIKTFDYTPQNCIKALQFTKQISKKGFNLIKKDQPRFNKQKNNGLRKNIKPNISASEKLTINPTEDQFINITLKSKYLQFLEQCREKNIKFTDSQFPPQDKSLGVPAYVKKLKDKLINSKTPREFGGWKRISQIQKFKKDNKEIFLYKTIQATDIKQGRNNTCYFLSSLSAIAANQKILISKLFGNSQFSKQGIYMAKFYVEGILVQIFVDDFIPVDKNDKPIFTDISPQQNQIWGIILQKCWAKLHKNYENIQFGFPQQALYALTGCPYSLKSPQNWQLDPKRRLLQFQKMCAFRSKPTPTLFCACTSLDEGRRKQFEKKGLVLAHAYTILELHMDPIPIIKLRNPHGYNKNSQNTNENNGILGFYYNWKPELQKFYGDDTQKYLNQLKQIKIDVLQDQKKQKGGEFYMHYDDFMNHFSRVSACYLKNGLNLLSLRSNFQKNKAKFFQFQLDKQSQVIVSLCQKFQRMQPQKIDNKTKRKFEIYDVTTLVLAKRVKIKKPKNKGSSQLIVKSQTSIVNHFQNQQNYQKNQQQVIQYQYISSRSNSRQTPFNFLVLDYALDDGRYVIYVISDVKSKTLNKDMTLTVHSNDSSFPSQLESHQKLFELYQTKKQTSIRQTIASITDTKKDTSKDYQIRFLQMVFLDRIKTNAKINKHLFIEQNLFQTQLTLQDVQQLQKRIQEEIDLQNKSWYSFTVPSCLYAQKTGGYGFFACSLSKQHPRKQVFVFNQRQYNRRRIFFVQPEENNNSKDVQLQVRPGQTKILLMKAISYKQQKDQQEVEFRKKYSQMDLFTPPPQPERRNAPLSMKNKTSFASTSLGDKSNSILISTKSLPA